MAFDKKLKIGNRFNKNTILTYAGAIASLSFGLFVLYSFSVAPDAIIPSAVSLIIIASAFTFVGALLGLLFGIPKSNHNQSVENRITENTNLEEVSDWLTKIILGFGIAEISEIHNSISELLGYLIELNPDIGEKVLLGIIIFYPIYGFIFGWLITRVHLTELFVNLRRQISDNVNKIKLKVQKINDDAVYYTEKGIVPGLDNSVQIPEIIADVNFVEENNYLLEWSLYNKLGVIFSAGNNFGLACQYFDKSFKLSGELKPRVNYGVVLSSQFNKSEEAIEIFQEIIKNNPDHDIIPNAYYNLACAYSRLNNAPKSIDSLQKAIDGKSSFRKISQKDSAFQNIADTDEFKNLVKEYAPETHQHFNKIE